MSEIPESTYNKLLHWITYINGRLRPFSLVLTGIPSYWNGGWTVRFRYVGETTSFLERIDILGELISGLKDEFLAQGFTETDLDAFEAKVFRRDLEFNFRILASRLELFIQDLVQV